MYWKAFANFSPTWYCRISYSDPEKSSRPVSPTHRGRYDSVTASGFPSAQRTRSIRSTRSCAATWRASRTAGLGVIHPVFVCRTDGVKPRLRIS